MVKIQAAVVQFIVVELNEAGEPIGEGLTKPAKVFRASAPDIWAFGDQNLVVEAEIP